MFTFCFKYSDGREYKIIEVETVHYTNGEKVTVESNEILTHCFPICTGCVYQLLSKNENVIILIDDVFVLDIYLD